MPRISIVVPCYNSARFLAETVDSVRQQTLTDWELVLVDDGSSDSTPQLITSWAAADFRIKAICKPNEGTCRTRNRGFAACDPQSPYLFFLDHDDLIVPHFVEVMCSHLSTHPEVGLLACHFDDISETGQKLGTSGPRRIKPGFLLPHTMRDHEMETPFVTFFSRTGRGPFAVYRRSVYEQTTGWEIAFWPDEDTDMFCQMALLAKVHFIPDRLYLKRVLPGQGSQNHALVAKSSLQFRQKWDNFAPRNEREAEVLRQARYFFYCRYRPAQHLRAVARALVSFFKTGDFRNFRTEVFTNLSSALHCYFHQTLPTP